MLRKEGGGTAVLTSALEYRRLGLAPLPLRGKRPAVELIRKTHGSPSTQALAASGSEEDHLRFWFSDPHVNVGIFCGEPSGGLVVVDLDDCDFPPAGAHFPTTPLVKTGRSYNRGYHIYLRTYAQVRNRKLPHGEICAVAPRYVVAPPSVHPDTGRTYRWEVPLADHPLADFEHVVLAQEDADLSPKHNISPTRDPLLGPPPTRDKKADRWLQGFDADRQSVEAMARVLGIPAQLGRPFRCVIHTERNPSASLYELPSGVWLYHDFHANRHAAKEWLTLAQVRAVQAGRTLPLAAPEHATWHLILLAEAGVLPPATVPAAPLPRETAGFVAHVYERFLFLLGCRWNYDHGRPAPFDRRFAAALAQVPERTAREAIEELQRLEAIYVADRVGRTRLWLPAGISSRHQPNHERRS